MHDAFISYRRKPSSALALAIQEKLKNRHGIDAYVDTTRTDGTRVQFPERLMTAIADAPVFICLLGERDGEHTLDSAWVLKEIEHAHALKKFCIPIFQESYRPKPEVSEAVSYLLNFDAVHVMDERNILIDASVEEIAALIPRRQQRRRTTMIVGVIVLLAVILGGLALFNQSGGSPTPTPTTQAAFVPSAILPAIVEPTEDVSPAPAVDTTTPTQTDTPTRIPPRETAMPTPNPTQRELTLEAVMVALQTEQMRTQQVGETQTATALTATATLWTATPTLTPSRTPDDRATAAARLTATQVAANATATASRWTPTPTRTPTLTQLEAALQRARAGVSTNAEWTPYGEAFDGVTMMLVPAGCFRMGSTDGYSDERPVHDQCITEPFWIDQTEVTQEQFARLGGVKANPNGFSGAQRPVERITWFEARDFCARRGMRLPTEAEWEYAARGPDALVYPWGNNFVAVNVVYSDNSNGQTADVMSRPAGASWVGAHDMSGNIWEWTRSLYQDYPYDTADGREDQDNRTGVRVLRGGSWLLTSNLLRSAYRVHAAPSYRGSDGGFRCALSGSNPDS